MRRLSFLLLGIAIVLLPGAAAAGNGAPSGSHYTLNLIGYAKGETVKSTNGNTAAGKVIHVPLYGSCKIGLIEANWFDVRDNNCTDGSASFALPNPDPTNSGTSEYSVYVATRGKPLGSATVSTCFYDTLAQQTFCAVGTVLERNFGPSKYTNMTSVLLYAYVCDGGTIRRVPLFADNTEDWYWQYDNNGLRNAQLRFYQTHTVVPNGGQAC